MPTVASVNIPENILLSLREPVEVVGMEMKRALAVRYYAEKRLSLGQCAEFAEMNEKEFIQYLSKYKISVFNYDSEGELREDINNA